MRLINFDHIFQTSVLPNAQTIRSCLRKFTDVDHITRTVGSKFGGKYLDVTLAPDKSLFYARFIFLVLLSGMSLYTVILLVIVRCIFF